MLGWQPRILVKWLECLLHSQKVVGSIQLYVLCKIYISHIRDIFQLCRKGVTWLSRFIFIVTEGTVFQIERKECNIPISIGMLLAIWLVARVFSQAVRVSAS